MEQYKKSVAFFGGAFNPVHKGHWDIATAVLGKLDFIDELWFCPCFRHRFNKNNILVAAQHRIRMLSLACQDISERAFVFPYEVNYRLDGSTANLFRKLSCDAHFKDIQFYLVVGTDNINNFSEWKDSEWLRENVRFIVLPRQTDPPESEIKWFKSEPHVFLHNVQIPKISSTDVRKKLADLKNHRLELCDLLGIPILEYIVREKLYRKPLDIKQKKCKIPSQSLDIYDSVFDLYEESVDEAENAETEEEGRWDRSLGSD